MADHPCQQSGRFTQRVPRLGGNRWGGGVEEPHRALGEALTPGFDENYATVVQPAAVAFAPSKTGLDLSTVITVPNKRRSARLCVMRGVGKEMAAK